MSKSLRVAQYAASANRFPPTRDGSLMPIGRNSSRSWLPSARLALTNWSRFTCSGENPPGRSISARGKGVGLVALDPPALERLGGAAGVGANQRIAPRRKRAEKMRHERAAFEPNLGALTFKPLQGRNEHLRVRVPRQTTCRPRRQRPSPSACPQPHVLQTWSSLLSVRHSQIRSRKLHPLRQRAATSCTGCKRSLSK
jgi:hypothetical protein